MVKVKNANKNIKLVIIPYKNFCEDKTQKGQNDVVAKICTVDFV